MSAEMAQPDKIQERLAEADELLKQGKVELPDEIFKRAEEGIKEIARKQDSGELIFASDFDFVDELREAVEIGLQYNNAMENIQCGGLYNPEKPIEGDTKAPTQKEVINALISKVTPEDKEVIAQMKEPVLQIVPIIPISDYLTALNKNTLMFNKKGSPQMDAYVSDGMKDVFGMADTCDNAITGRIAGWRAVITEGADAPSILSGDDTRKTFKERCTWFKNNFGSKGISGIDIKSYILLQMAGLAKTPPRPVDDHQRLDSTLTMLNAEEIFEDRVAVGFWITVNHRRVVLDERNACTCDSIARFRPSIVVDLPKS